jgi:alcohol dehydrogenase class-P
MMFMILSLLCLQELELEKFITVPFSEINHAFDLMAKGEGIRCIIRMEN